MLYHGSPYGKETIPIYELLAEKYGFTVEQIEVPHPGNEQQSQWLQIRRERPDYVVLRGWGVMNPVALTTAQRNGFPADRIIGNVWSNSEEDVLPGRRRRDRLHRDHHPGLGRPSIRCCRRSSRPSTTPAAATSTDTARIGSVYHNLGIVNGILNVEAVRIAQEKFGNRTLTGDEVRWGFEHLQLDPARVKELGAENLFHSINVTWDNHEGEGYVTFQQWDGAKWNVVSDWIAPDWALLRPIIEKSVRGLRHGEGHHDPHRRPTPTTSSPTEPEAAGASRPPALHRRGASHGAPRPVLLTLRARGGRLQRCHRRAARRRPRGARRRDRGAARRQRRRQDHAARRPPRTSCRPSAAQ